MARFLRPRVVAPIAVVALVVAVVGGSLWYRASGPRLEQVGFGVGTTTHVGETVYIGVPAQAAKGAFTITAIDARRAAGNPGDAALAWSITDVDGTAIGTARGRLVDVAPSAVPAVGDRVDRRQRQLLLSFDADRTGVYRFEGVRVSYGSGLRTRTTELPVSICVAVLPMGAAHTDVDATERC